jgi:hypothetical protein
MVQILFRDKIDCNHLLGKFLDDSHYDILIDSDTDAYARVNTIDGEAGEDERFCLFKFRKNAFSKEDQQGVYEGLIKAAVETQNRGMAAGPKGEKLLGRDWVTDWQLEALDLLMKPMARLDGVDPIVAHIQNKASFKEDSSRGLVWLRSKIATIDPVYEGFFDRWLERVIKLDHDERKAQATEFAKTYISQTTYANPVNSGVAGFFDRYPRYPYGRSCAYNHQNPELFSKSFPYLRKLNKAFSKLLPARWANQKAAADRLDKRFLVGEDTVFTTLTVNRTFRTAAHLDAGDLGSGFSNLGVISTGKDFKGGYLVLPEYRVAINIRPGDLLLIANHDAIHGNTPIEAVDGDEAGIERMSIVAYFREKMLDLGSWEYETARRDYVESRRLNENHPEWRPQWNGVSASMFSQQEWYDYLAAYPNGSALLEQYHPEAVKETAATLDSFFS